MRRGGRFSRRLKFSEGEMEKFPQGEESERGGTPIKEGDQLFILIKEKTIPGET